MKKYLVLYAILFAIDIQAQVSLSINDSLIVDGFYGMTLHFQEGGEFFLDDVKEDSKYASFELHFKEPVSEEGLTVRAFPNVFDIPVGATSIEGFFTKRRWAAFSLRSENEVNVGIKEVVLIDSTGNRSFANSNYYGFATRRFTWTDEDGIFHAISVSASHHDVRIVDVFSGKVTIKNSNFLGGEKWAAMKTEQEPIVYRLSLNEPVVSGGHLSWRFKLGNGTTRYIPIEDGVMFSEISIDEDVNDCRIVYQGASEGEVSLNISNVILKSGMVVTEVGKLHTKLPDKNNFNLLGQKVNDRQHGLLIVRDNNGKTIKRLNK